MIFTLELVRKLLGAQVSLPHALLNKYPFQSIDVSCHIAAFLDSFCTAQEQTEACSLH